MSRRGENIYKRKDGRWEGRYIKGYYEGKARYGYIYARTYKEVRDKLLTIVKTIEFSPKQSLYVSKDSINENFGVVANEWFASLKPQLKESSIVKYSNILDNYLLPAFGVRQIDDISRNDVIAFSNQILANGGVKGNGLSPKTVTGIISVFKSIFVYTMQTKKYQVADLRNISIKQPQKPMKVLNRTEQKKLSNYLCQHLTLCNLGILLSLYTGLRIGEICALKWGDISFEEQLLHIKKTMQRIQKKGDGKKRTIILESAPKSDCSIRTIPIPDDVFRLIADQDYPQNAYFLTGMAHKYIEPRTMQNHFKAVIKDCGISNTNFHALRHNFATHCVELGFDLKCLSEILGHASVNITLNRYVHPSMELKQKNMNMFSDLFSVQ